MTLAIVGGYRLVRRLGGGVRADVWLGHPVKGPEAAASPVAIKLYRATVSAASATTEIEALARAAGAHVVAVHDLATAADGRTALVMERLSADSLSGLLSTRSALSRGEAVTVLVPLAQALSRMHAAGVTHGGIRASAVGFTNRGAPVLMCFAAASAAPGTLTTAQRDVDERFLADARAFRALCDDVLEEIRGAEGVRQWLTDAGPGAGWIAELPQRLFAWAAPEPVRFDVPGIEAMRPAATSVPLRRPRDPHVTVRDRIGRIADLLARDWIEVGRRHLASVRPRFWILGGGVAVALLTAVAFAPGTSTEAAPPAASPAATAQPPAEDASPVLGDDPEAALRVLLATRDRCIRDLSVLCLDDVDQPGSSALAEDQALVRDLQEGGEDKSVGVFDVDGIVLEERLGGTALLTVTSVNGEPASVLVMRSEAGWRIRDYLE